MKTLVLKVWEQRAPVLFKRTKHMKGAFGVTTCKKGKYRIFVDPKVRKKKRLEVLIHEALHVADWSKDEEWVADTAEGIAKMLWDLGYRSKKESK